MRRRLLGAAAASAVVAGLLTVPTASALGSPVAGSFLCESSSSSLGGTVVGNPQTLLSTITVPASTSDIASPVKATVTVTAPSGGSMPASPPVALADVVMTQYDVRLDIFTTTTNSPAAITGAPATGALGIKKVVVPIAGSPVLPRTPWAAPVDNIEVQLPAGTPGQRQWLRLKELTYHWSAASGSILGTTTCRLVGPIVAASGTVETPLYGFFSSLSSTWPESATNFSSSDPATFGSELVMVSPPPTGPIPASFSSAMVRRKAR